MLIDVLVIGIVYLDCDGYFYLFVVLMFDLDVVVDLLDDMFVFLLGVYDECGFSVCFIMLELFDVWLWLLCLMEYLGDILVLVLVYEREILYCVL